MKTLTHRLVFAAAMLGGLVSTQPAHATTIAVGTCHTSTPSYPTIQQAVDALNYLGGTVLICPGVYPEQVKITRPVILQGLSSGTQQSVSIVAPGTGLLANYDNGTYLAPFAAHILVLSANATLANLDIEGAGAACTPSGTEAGVASVGSNVIITNSIIRNMSSPYVGCPGIAIYSEGIVGFGSLTLQNSTLNVFRTGIYSINNSSVTVNNSTFTDGTSGIEVYHPTAPMTLSGNTLQGLGCHAADCSNDANNQGGGIVASPALPGSMILNNTVEITPTSGYSLNLIGTATVTGNKLSGGTYGIKVDATNSIVQSNIISNAIVGVEIYESSFGYNLITKNTFKFNGCGLWVHLSYSDTVTPNTFVNNRTSVCQ